MEKLVELKNAVSEFLDTYCTEKEKKWLIEFATKQYPSSDSNMGTRFPVIFTVIDYDYVETNNKNDSRRYTFYGLGQYKKYEYFSDFINKLKKSVSQLLEFYEELDITKEEYETLSCYDFDNCEYFSDISRKIKNILNKLNIEISEKYYAIKKRTIATFLTKKAAEDYLEYQSHNLSSEAFVYGDYIGYANNGDIEPLCRLLLKLGLLVTGETDINKYDKML